MKTVTLGIFFFLLAPPFIVLGIGDFVIHKGLTIARQAVLVGADVKPIEAIAHPTPGSGSSLRLADSTNWMVSRTEARLALAVLTTERKAA